MTQEPAAQALNWPAPPSPDPRVGLRAGVQDAGEAIWNLRLLSKTQPPPEFAGTINSDLAFTGRYAIQGNFGGFQIWDVSNPAAPRIARAFVCPASQSDVSVYRNLLFVSGEDLAARLDCGRQGVRDSVSADRLRGIRIFDISDINNPRNVGNVQTCRGSHTHTVVEDPRDPANVYIYVSGSAPVRSGSEMPGCIGEPPEKNPNSALFRIEVIRVPLANPSQAAIVNSPRIFAGLLEPPTHGEAPEDIAAAKAAADRARAAGQFVFEFRGQVAIVPPNFTRPLLDSIVRARNGTGQPTAADSAALRANLNDIVTRMLGLNEPDTPGPRPGPTQCHDITVYPAIGLAGGACEGYGLLIDIRNVARPERITAAADSNFAYWHSATFSNDGTKVLFTDEWGGGGGPKCRATDRKEWGANAIFSIVDRKLVFRSYYKLPAAQTSQENCVAHNGSLIPIPGRDVMVQSWYQGGISVFDWTDAANPVEIAFHDRGPLNAAAMQMAGSWSVYWYNGVIVSSEIARGLDILELTPSAYLTQNEIDAAKTVKFEQFNAQMQPKFVWPPSFALARAYLDQLERTRGLSGDRIASARSELTNAERASGEIRRNMMAQLARTLNSEARGAHASKVRALADAVAALGS
jgi:hypothetical protein